jgi:outer membrane protein assembly factor BamB
MGFFEEIRAVFGKRGIGLEKRVDFKVGAPITTSLTSAMLDGKKVVVFATKNGKVYAINEDAEVEWVYDATKKFTETELFFLDESVAKNIYSTPAIADINKDGKKEVIFGSESGTLHVLNSYGKLLWHYKAKGSIRSMAIIGDINNDDKAEIIFGSMDGNLYALNQKGKLVWKFKADSGIEGTAAILKNKSTIEIIFGSNDGTIYSIDKNGELLWQFKTGGKITAQPAIGKIYNNDQNYIIVGSFDGFMYALTEDGKLEWKYKTEGNIFSKACLADINNDKKLEVIFGSCDDKIYALSSKGDKIWSYETDFWVAITPIVEDINNDGKLEVIVGSYDHSLYILDAEGTFLLNYMPGISGITQQTGHYNDLTTTQPGNYYGKKLWQYKTDGMIVASAYITNQEKNIIIGTDNGKLNFFTPIKN